MKSSKKGETRSRSRSRSRGRKGIVEEEEEELQKVEEGEKGVDCVFQFGAAGGSAQKQRRWKEREEEGKMCKGSKVVESGARGKEAKRSRLQRGRGSGGRGQAVESTRRIPATWV